MGRVEGFWIRKRAEEMKWFGQLTSVAYRLLALADHSRITSGASEKKVLPSMVNSECLKMSPTLILVVLFQLSALVPNLLGQAT